MKHLVIASLLLSSNIALSMVKTNSNLSPEAGQSEFAIGAAYMGGSAASSATNQSADITGYLVPISYFYGVNANDSFGISLGYNSQETKISNSTTKLNRKGFTDAELAYKGNYDFMGATFYSKAGSSIPLVQQTSNWDTGEDNFGEGRFIPFLEAALVFPVQSFALGVSGRYNVGLEGNKDITLSGSTENYTAKGGGGYEVAVFGEIENSFHPNLSLKYVRAYDTQYTRTNTQLTYTKPTVYSIEASMRFNLTGSMEVLPSLQYITPVDKSSGSYSKYDIFAGGATLRALF